MSPRYHRFCLFGIAIYSWLLVVRSGQWRSISRNFYWLLWWSLWKLGQKIWFDLHDFMKRKDFILYNCNIRRFCNHSNRMKLQRLCVQWFENEVRNSCLNNALKFATNSNLGPQNIRVDKNIQFRFSKTEYHMNSFCVTWFVLVSCHVSCLLYFMKSDHFVNIYPCLFCLVLIT